MGDVYGWWVVLEVLPHFACFPPGEVGLFGVESVEFVGDCGDEFDAGDLGDVAGYSGGEVGLFDGFVVAVEAADECFVGVVVDDEVVRGLEFFGGCVDCVGCGGFGEGGEAFWVVVDGSCVGECGVGEGCDVEPLGVVG